MSGATRPGPSGRMLCPAALILGAVAAFVACCVAGRLAARRNFYKHFVRFDPYRNPMTFYYPTASQVRALARERLDRKRVAVIVGGNSILNGIGQHTARVWTRSLQNLLGDDYRVLNLAMLGAETGEFAGTMAEILEAEYDRVIYLGILNSSTNAGDPDGNIYRYFFWDAHFKGMVPPCPERLRYLADQEEQRRKQGDHSLTELKAGRRLDGRLYYQDLWTAWTYTKLSTVWAPLLRNHFPRPRQAIPDFYDVEAPAGRAPPPSEGDMKLLVSFAETAGAQAIGRPLPPPGERASLRSRPADSPLVRNLWRCFPPPTRQRSLILVISDNPTYVERLPPRTQDDYHWGFARLAEVIRAAGFPALAVGEDFSGDDFIDRCHLTEQGGRALAQAVAPKVRELARRLGYLKETRRP